MKIAVTGASGKLGRLVIEELKERTSAENIVALVRNPQKVADLGVEAREFDYDQAAQQSTTLKGVDKLLLISGNEIGKRLPQHINVIEAAKNAGIKTIVYTSLLKADSSTLGLAGEHIGTEEVLKKSGIPHVILRNGWYTENYTESLQAVIGLGTLYGSSGDGKISSATRGDYAAAAATVLTSEGQEGKVYELAGDEAFTMSDYAAEISRQTGKDIPYVNLPESDYAQALIKSGLPEGLAQFLASSHVSTEKGDLFDDGHQLSKLIGRPSTSLSEAISAALA
ncbi:SDR family oxidoreductase [Cyclobacterium amurskyense]|uniref:Male sterility domain protein n=1 Tax=Cyclobacterium amurskyense TaxID=320787 RepID=A0A0H4PFK8_9BACT|nr:SDR family oxidoreductase [Cyclobacterium amurskyense]AKP51613.1 Male sterility domain protein [Cyclobacterium amurskyense]|tara:strand:+ start:385 stop:1230 length:846 start_codon:yes stop_codon:yes gene_type:complete